MLQNVLMISGNYHRQRFLKIKIKMYCFMLLLRDACYKIYTHALVLKGNHVQIVWATMIWLGNVLRITGYLYGETTTGGYPTKRLIMWSFDVFFVVSLNKLLNKQSSDWCLSSTTLAWHHIYQTGRKLCKMVYYTDHVHFNPTQFLFRSPVV